ncbi:MAG: PTS sugar transporter subunit IIA [Spirochaetota bacterium]
MDMIQFLRDYKAVCLQAEAADWKAAVKLGTSILERAGTITPQYYTAICSSVEELGPYFLLGPGLAMPHARPEQGVLADSFALVTLKTPVNFGDPDNDPIDILLTMAAKSSQEQNETAIVQVVELLDNEARVAQLRAARTMADLQAIFTSMKA